MNKNYSNCIKKEVSGDGERRLLSDYFSSISSSERFIILISVRGPARGLPLYLLFYFKAADVSSGEEGGGGGGMIVDDDWQDSTENHSTSRLWSAGTSGRSL